MRFPIFSQGYASNRDKIINIIAMNSKVTTKQIHILLKNRYGVNLTYQAVHKTVKQLVEQDILKEKKKLYYFNEEWLDHLRQLIDRVNQAKVDSSSLGSKEALNMVKNMSNMDIINLNFKTLHELDNFIFSFENFFIKNLAEKGEEITIAQRHNRYPVMYPTYKQNIQESEKQKKISYFIICEGDTILDNWATGIYAEKDMIVVNDAKYSLEEDELMVFGDLIIRIYFSNRLRERLDEVFKKVNSLNEFYPEKIFKEVITTTGVTVSVQKNGHFGKTIKEKLKKLYLSKEFQKILEGFKERKKKGKQLTFDVEDLYLTTRQIDYYTNFIVPYLSEAEVKLIDTNIEKYLPYEIFKKNYINIIDISANVGSKSQKIFTDFYKKYKINYYHITPSKKLKEISEEFFFKYPQKDINYHFFHSKMKDLPSIDIFAGTREPSVFLFLDYVYGNYNSDFFIDILKKIIIPNDLIVITLQFTPEKLSKKIIDKILYYYKHRYEGYRFDCGVLYEIGFKEEDLKHHTEFNKEKRRIESYSVIKHIPKRLAKDVQDVGFIETDKILNYFSRKPSISQFKSEITDNFLKKIFIDKETFVGVVFCRLKT